MSIARNYNQKETMRIDIDQLNFIDPTLRHMAVWIEENTGLEFTVTSLYRPGDLGVHGTIPVRGMDLRCRSMLIGTTISELVNTFFKYDEERPHLQCCVLHGNDSNLHLHLQVHTNTKFLGEK